MGTGHTGGRQQTLSLSLRALRREAGWGKALRGAEPASPELGCCQSRLLGSLVPQVFAHMIQLSHPSSNHIGYSSALSYGENEGEIRAHFPHIFARRGKQIFSSECKKGDHV